MSSRGGTHGGGYSSRSVKGASSHGGSAKHSGYSGGNKGKVSHQASGKNRFPSAESGDKVSHPWSMQRTNEERKLNHRLGVADKLDRIAEQNGNSNLHDTAERKREKAHQLYEKRMAKIEGKDPSPEAGDDLQNPLEPPADPTDRVSRIGDPDAPDPDYDPTTTSQKLTGRENALYRQVRNEQRKLAKRMETAERLWDAYEQTGDEQLADVARAFEERALGQYEKRVDAIRDFQERHGLPDMIGDGLPPDSPISGSPGAQSDTLGETIAPLLDVLP